MSTLTATIQHNHLPVEHQSTAATAAQTEMRLARVLCRLSPAVFVLSVPIIYRYLLFWLYLQPVRDEWQLAASFQSAPSLAGAAVLAAIPWIWRAGISLQKRLPTSVPWACGAACLLVLGAAMALHVPRVTWFFVEWVKVRTPNPSFARNTLFWEQRNFESSGPANADIRVGLVGSSQTYQGFDLQQLSAARPGWQFEKNTLAGFGPLQYAYLYPRIAERQFDIVVCQLSEFDFFREDRLPVNRLRWASSTDSLKLLVPALSTDQKWQNRGELADLSAAAALGLWRQRDHVRRTVFHYWWKRSDPPPSAAESDATARLADAPSLQQAIHFLRQNVGHKKLVDANFRAFRIFAQQVRQHNQQLIVVAGHVHPQARAAYDPDGRLHRRTHNQLKQMSSVEHFDYFGAEELPAFSAADFADAYHLNSAGRRKLTNALASILQNYSQAE